jgi:hypothetical protein
MDLQFNSQWVTPTGNVAFGEDFADYRQGTADTAAGLIDEAGALATEGGVGAARAAPFNAWEFRRAGPGAPGDPNSQVEFAADPGEGTATILPANFALVGLGTPVDWNNVTLDTVNLNLALGDFNGDGAVNHFDLALWIPHVFSSAGSDNFDPKFDLNGDSRVDPADLAILMPRLYRPIFSEGQTAAPTMAQTRRIGSPLWETAAHDDLDWVGSIPSLGQHKREIRRQNAAVDHVLHAYCDPRLPV